MAFGLGDVFYFNDKQTAIPSVFDYSKEDVEETVLCYGLKGQSL